jgi:hypothetical protein
MLSSIFIPLRIDEEVVGRRAGGRRGRGAGKHVKLASHQRKDNNAKRLRTHAKVTNE